MKTYLTISVFLHSELKKKMKKQIRQISKFALCLLAHTLVVGLLFPAQAVAQTKKPTPKAKPIFWYMDYTVTVKGNGRKEGDASGSPTIDWRVDRTYSGGGVLDKSDVNLGNNPAILMNPQKVAEAYKSKRNLRFTRSEPKGSDAPTRVEINDLYALATVDPCDDGTEETAWDLKIWRTSATYPGLSGTSLFTYSQLRTYNVFIPIFFIGGTIPMVTQTRYERTGGVKSSKQNTLAKTTQVGIPRPPNVEGLFNGAIEHNIALPQPPNFSTVWEYDTLTDLGELTPDEPIFPDVPESKTEVKIRIRYRFSKTPLY